MNEDDCYNKCNDLVREEKTYQKLKPDLTNKFKKQFVSNLKDLIYIKVINHPLLQMKLYYPTVDQSRRFYGLPRIKNQYAHETNCRLHWNHLLPMCMISGDNFVSNIRKNM